MPAWLGRLALEQVARGLEVELGDHRLQEGGLHPLPFARALALQQRDEDADRRIEPGAEIRDRDADAHRPPAGLAGNRHEPAHALGDLIEARPLGVRAVLTEAGKARVDEAGVERAECLVVDAEPVLHVGPVVLHHHVGLGGEALEDGDALRLLEVESEAPLVAVQILEVGAVAGLDGIVRRPRRPGRFDLDDVGAPVGELARRGRPRPVAGEVEHRKARKSAVRRRMSHRNCSTAAVTVMVVHAHSSEKSWTALSKRPYSA